MTGASTSRAATTCAICDKEVQVASNPNGQTHITYYHGDCYRQRYYDELHHAGPVHAVSYEERVEEGELPP